MITPLTFRHTSRYLVYYEDTDFTGYVFHPNYLKFFDRAREDIFGPPRLRSLYDDGLHFVVRRAEVDYMRPAGHGQELLVTSECSFSRAPSIKFVHSVSVGDESICVGRVELVSVNERGFPVRLPEEVFTHLMTFVG